jgi:purine-binding chemotaxis protein CheW
MEQRTQYLAFSVGGDEYAVPILDVRELVRFEGATRVPSTPPWIRGVVNLRGQVLPLLDLAVKFGLESGTTDARACVVVFELPIDGHPTSVGALVESVSQVLDLAPAEIEPPPSFGTQIRVEYLVGTAVSNGRFVLLLDGQRVLSADELLGVAHAVASAAEASLPAAAG